MSSFLSIYLSIFFIFFHLFIYFFIDLSIFSSSFYFFVIIFIKIHVNKYDRSNRFIYTFSKITRSRFIARRFHISKSLKRVFQAESQQFFKRKRINEFDFDDDNDIDKFDVFNIEYDDNVFFHNVFIIFSIDELNVDNLNERLQQYIIAKTNDFQKSIIEEFLLHEALV